MNEQDMSRDEPLVRLSVPEAASRLGVTQSAIRKRVQRKLVPFDKDERGFTYVYLRHGELRDSDNGDNSPVTCSSVTGQTASESHLAGPVEELRDRVTFLEKQVSFLQDELRARREESQRKDAIMLNMSQRIPELEPAAEPPESPETATGGTEGGGGRPH